MPILFSAVAHNKNMVAEFASCDGNFLEIIQQISSKIPWRDEKMTYYHGPYLIHYVLEEQYLYICITDKVCQRSRAFLFLNEIHRRFLTSGKEDFVKVLAAEMYRYSEDYSTITIRKGEIDELNKIGVESSETILGEKMLFVNNPENISYATVSYVGKTPEPVSISGSKSSEELESINGDKILPESVSKTCTLNYAEPSSIPDLTSPEISISDDNMAPDTTSIQKSRLFIIVIGVIMFIIGLVYVFGPMSCVVVVGVVACSIVRCFDQTKKSD